MQTRTKALLCNISAMILCIVPPVIATLEHFPIWLASGGEVMFSGLGIVLLVLCALPFKRQTTQYLRSPAAWVMWLCIFVFATLFSNIIKDIAAISLVAFVSNLAGAILFKMRDKYNSELSDRR